MYNLEYFTDDLYKFNINKIVEYINKYKNDKKILRRYIEKTNDNVPIQPAKNFSKQIGLNIHNNFILPFNDNWDICEFYIGFNRISNSYDKNNFELFKLYDIFCKLNPELYNIKIKTIRDIYDVLYGVTSSFNYDDIFDWIEIGSNLVRSNEEKERKDKIEKMVGFRFEYVPSEKTLLKIEKHIGL